MEKIIKPALERNQWYVDFCWEIRGKCSSPQKMGHENQAQ